MITKSALRELAKRLAHDRERLGSGLSTRNIGEALVAESGAVSGLVELIAAEAVRKRPSVKLVSAYLFTLGEVLESIRLAVDRDLPEAAATVEAARAAVLAQVEAGALGGRALMRVVAAFAQARLEPGEPLRAALGVRARENTGIRAAIALLADVAGAVGSDPFRIHAEIAEQMATSSAEDREALAGLLLAAADDRLREAAVGCLLDDDPAIRLAAAEALRRAAQAKGVSGVMLRRMIAVRNWIPAPERGALDAAILSARQTGLEIEPLPAPVIKGVHVSGFDGSGAQSLVALTRDGTRHAALAALFHLGDGIRDAWARRGLTLAGGRTMVAEMEVSVGVIRADLDYLRLALPHFLARGVESARSPPFGMVDIAERLGLAAINPAWVAPSDLIERLVEAIPEPLKTPMAVERALLGSGTWNRRLPFVDSWFEDDPTILSPAAGLHLSRFRRLDLILVHVLPGRRRWWSEVIGWTALALRGEARAPTLWIDMALVAREILNGRRLSEIPAMTYIAGATVEAWGVRA